MFPRDVEHLYAKSLEDLYEELGRAVVTSEFRKPLATREFAVRQGKSFISDHIDKLKAKVCVDWHYCNKRNDYGNFQALAYAIAPLVSSVVGVPATTAMIVALILIKIGLDDLCKCPGA